MKVLVYGVGVIGSLTVHELCKAGNDVTIVARGEHLKVLEENGLVIQSHSTKKEWTDHPRVIAEYDGDQYDVTFSIMQNQQQEKLLNTLAKIQTRYLVLVGNNMLSKDMEETLRLHGNPWTTILFGFQTSAGLRHETYTEVVTFGVPVLTIGHLKKEMDSNEKSFFRSLFKGSSMQLEWMDDMESWYDCHAAFIIPIACIAYAHHCDIRTCGKQDMIDYLKAGKEAYDFLKSIHVPIRPINDDKNLNGFRGKILSAGMWVIAKTSLGEQAVTNHCRNAVTEMQFLDEQFENLRQKNPSFPMPTFDRLRNEMPSWQDLHQLYDKK